MPCCTQSKLSTTKNAIALDMKVGCKRLKFGKHQSKTEQNRKNIFLTKHKNCIFLLCILILFLKNFIFMWK